MGDSVQLRAPINTGESDSRGSGKERGRVGIVGKKGEEWERKEEGGNSGGDRCVYLYARG